MPRKAKSAAKSVSPDAQSEAVEAALAKVQPVAGAAGDAATGSVNERIRQLIRQSKEQGYLTWDDIN